MGSLQVFLLHKFWYFDILTQSIAGSLQFVWYLDIFSSAVRAAYNWFWYFFQCIVGSMQLVLIFGYFSSASWAAYNLFSYFDIWIFGSSAVWAAYNLFWYFDILIFWYFDPVHWGSLQLVFIFLHNTQIILTIKYNFACICTLEHVTALRQLYSSFCCCRDFVYLYIEYVNLTLCITFWCLSVW